MGTYSLQLNTIGNNNTGLGYFSLGYNTTGNNNIAIGYQAGDNLDTGSNNIVIGYDINAPSATSANTLNIGNLIFATGVDGTQNTLSTGNVGIGITAPTAKLYVNASALNASAMIVDRYTSGGVASIQAGPSNEYLMLEGASTTGRVGINFYSSGDVLLANGGGKVGIGITVPTYQLQLSTNSAAKPTSNAWTIASDIRVKEDIEPFTDGLNVINQLNPITYKLNGKAGFTKGQAGISLIANDVKDIIPYAVSTYKAELEPTDAEETELYDFDSSPLTFVTINAIKELNNKVKVLESENKMLNKRIEILETR